MSLSQCTKKSRVLKILKYNCELFIEHTVVIWRNLSATKVFRMRFRMPRIFGPLFFRLFRRRRCFLNAFLLFTACRGRGLTNFEVYSLLNGATSFITTSRFALAPAPIESDEESSRGLDVTMSFSPASGGSRVDEKLSFTEGNFRHATTSTDLLVKISAPGLNSIPRLLVICCLFSVKHGKKLII